MMYLRDKKTQPRGDLSSVELSPDMAAALRYMEANAPERLEAPKPWPACRRVAAEIHQLRSERSRRAGQSGRVERAARGFRRRRQARRDRDGDVPGHGVLGPSRSAEPR